MKKIIDEIAFCADGVDYNLPEDPKGFIAWFTDKINLVPKEHRDSTRVVLAPINSYGQDTIIFTVTYQRPETDGEKSEREDNEKQREQFRESIDKQTFKNLKDKYGW